MDRKESIMKRVIAALAAGGVLVVGAFVASTVSTVPASALTDASGATADSVDPDTRPREAVLDEILASLVGDDTLTQDQADAVRERFEAKGEELMTERQARREAAREMRDLIEGFLDDDVITADELAQLPDDHPLRDAEGVFSDALADGQITRDELRAVRMEHRQARHERRDAWIGFDA
jgi:hypothetical protein